MVPKAKLVVACLILTSALTIQISEAAGGIATYWGQYADLTEGTLYEACATNLYSYINIAYLDHFGDGVNLQPSLFGHNCYAYCAVIGEQIRSCQSLGVKILLSLGGPFGNYTLTSEGDAERVAEQLWNSVLGGNDTSYGTPRLFGDVAVLDGIDFDIQHGSPLYYDELARQLKELSEQGNKTVYLSASPRCPYPDYYLETAIDTGLFDFVWVKFYNNTSCQYNNDTAAGVNTLLRSLLDWDSALKEGKKLFLGIPASNETDNSPLGGFIPADVLNTRVLPLIKDIEMSKYGGVMVWNRYFDRKTNYSASIIDYVKSTINNLPYLPTMSMHASA